jgi:glutathione S-transferase
MLKLYHWKRCGHSAIALIALHAKHLAFESAFIDLLRLEHYSTSFLTRNPLGHVPVLEHDGALITQTSAILEYLDETFPQHALMPGDTVGRWRVRVWAKILNEDVAPSVHLLAWHAYTRPSLSGEELARLRQEAAQIPILERREVWASACADAPATDQLEYSRRKLEVVLARMERELGGAPWLAGEHLSLADIQLYPMIAPVVTLLPKQLNPAVTPQVVGWLKRMSAQPSVQLAMGSSAMDREELLHLVPGPEHIRWG